MRTRVKLLHHSSEWLPGDYECPAELAGRNYLTAWKVTNLPSPGMRTMKLDRGTALWDADGKLRVYVPSGADLVWNNKTNALLSLELQFGRCSNREGVRHRIRLLDAADLAQKSEIELCVPTGGVSHLVQSENQEVILATWREEAEWGYVGIDLPGLSQCGPEMFWKSATLAPPQISKDDKHVVACNFLRHGWWTDEVDDYWDYPSPGGLRRIGIISVQEVSTGALTKHDVVVSLPKGWFPVPADDPDWGMIWGPEFVSERAFRIWLPDHSVEVLTLPLPPIINIERGLLTSRVP